MSPLLAQSGHRQTCYEHTPAPRRGLKDPFEASAWRAIGRTDGLLSVKFVLGSLSPFVHWSFVTPNVFGVRMIMVPPHARFAVVPIAFCSGFAGGLSGTLSFHVGGS
jgi:hypothetical protein